MLSEQMIVTLTNQPEEVLSTYWCELNLARCPTKLENVRASSDTMIKIMNWIVARVGIKVCLKEWNMSYLGADNKSEAEFEAWWRNSGRIANSAAL